LEKSRDIELWWMTATDLAARIRSREVSPVDLLEAHLERAERHDPALNVIVMSDAARARARARAAEEALAAGELWGPLHGLPITIKDAYDYIGMHSTLGFKPMARHRPDRNASVVERLLEAGAVIMGKTNMPELAFDWQCDSPIFGRTNNPWDLDRTSGGSTGGAAAVAAGLTPLEFGSDGAGSLRVPAHFCGVYTLKPTEGRVSGHGHLANPDAIGRVRHLVAYGPVARSVGDLRLALKAIAGSDGRRPEVPPVPLERGRSRSPSGRLLWCDELDGLSVTGEARRALAALVARLADEGWEVERRAPEDFGLDLALQTWGEIMGAQLGMNVPRLFLPPFRLRFRRQYGQGPWTAGVVRGMGLNMRTFMAALTRRDRYMTVLDSFLDGWDGWILPTACVPAFPHCPIGTDIEVDGTGMPYTMAAGAYTSIINLTGNPAVGLPIGRSQEGLPIGAQVVGHRWADMALLDLAEAIVGVVGPWERPPDYP
jgi:amidase